MFCANVLLQATLMLHTTAGQRYYTQSGYSEASKMGRKMYMAQVGGWGTPDAIRVSPLKRRQPGTLPAPAMAVRELCFVFSARTVLRVFLNYGAIHVHLMVNYPSVLLCS